MAVVELMIIRTDAPALSTALATGTVPFVPISVTAGLASVRLLAILVPSLLWLFLIFTSDRAGTRPASRVPHS